MKIGDQTFFNTVNGLKIGRIIAKRYGKYVIKYKGKLYRRYLKELKMKVYDEMVALAKAHNVEITENAVKIANFRERTGLPMDRCPCHPTISAPDRGCIGTICMQEIETLGQCCCRCFKKK